MISFTESNTVEALIRDLLCGARVKMYPARRSTARVDSTSFAPCRRHADDELIMGFAESNTVEALIGELLCGAQTQMSPARRSTAQVGSISLAPCRGHASDEMIMRFAESNTVEALIRRLLSGAQTQMSPARRSTAQVGSTSFAPCRGHGIDEEYYATPQG